MPKNITKRTFRERVIQEFDAQAEYLKRVMQEGDPESHAAAERILKRLEQNCGLKHKKPEA
jgi:hypothetical protein